MHLKIQSKTVGGTATATAAAGGGGGAIPIFSAVPQQRRQRGGCFPVMLCRGFCAFDKSF